MTKYSRLEYLSETRISEDEIPLGHPVMRFKQHWREIGGSEAVPLRQDFEPARIPSLLPYLVVLELVQSDEGLDLRARLEGEFLASLGGASNRGNSLRRVMTEERYQRRLEEARGILSVGESRYSAVEIRDHQQKLHKVYRGVFPFRVVGGGAGQVFVVMADQKLVLNR